MLLITGAAGATGSELLQRLNAYRAAPHDCDGAAGAAGPLQAEPRLARARAESGAALRQALQAVDYQAGSSQVITVTGPTTAQAALEFMVQRYCQALLEPQFTHAGVSRDGGHWQLILARPLLAEGLGNWERAGRALLREINRARSQPQRCGGRQLEAAPALAWNPTLATAALAHSRDMAQHDYFSHDGRDGSNVGQRASRAGYRWRQVGENLAAGQGSPDEVVAGWLQSPTHCANLMDPAFTEMGAAYALNPGTESVTYWTQVLGAPQQARQR